MNFFTKKKKTNYELERLKIDLYELVLTAVPKESLVLRPLRRTVPERKALAARRLARASSIVDFPEPEGPMRAVRVPGSA